MDLSQQSGSDYVGMSVEIVSAYVAHNSVPAGELPALISTIYASLRDLGTPAPAAETRPQPIVSAKKSIQPDYLISLEDGRHYKSLKRHLAGRGLTPQDYRAKWGLPSDYPMVAPNYAKQRSELARSMGLGKKRVAEPAPAPAPARRGGRRKAAA